jgi:hypothetical protein
MFAFGDGDGKEDDLVDGEPRQMPPWFGPPQDELGAVVQLGLVAARSDNGVVALSHVTVFSTGLALNVIAVARGLSERQSNRLFHEQHLFEAGEEPPSGSCRSAWSLRTESVFRISEAGGIAGASSSPRKSPTARSLWRTAVEEARAVEGS